MINNLIKKNFDVEKYEIINILSSLNHTQLQNFKILCSASILAIKKGGKIMFAGNGGSAADSQHLSTELTVRFKKNRKALPSIALTTDSSILTAVSNDFDFKKIFSRQLEALGTKNDIFIALTTSGNSKNLIEAAKTSKKIGIKSFCFSGNNGGILKKFIDYPIIINSKKTSAIQVIELMLGQVFCETLEDFFSKKK